MYDCGNHSAAPARAMSAPRAAGFLGGFNPTIAIAGLILATSFFRR